jgi:acid phosphatase class B
LPQAFLAPPLFFLAFAFIARLPVPLVHRQPPELDRGITAGQTAAKTPARWLRLAMIDRYFDWGQRPAARSSARWASRS